MESSDIPQLESQLADLEGIVRNVQRELRGMGEMMEAISDTCAGEPELLSVLQKEARYLRTLGPLMEDFHLVRQMRRRLPAVSSRLRREEHEEHSENAAVQREAEEIKGGLEDILRKFLRG